MLIKGFSINISAAVAFGIKKVLACFVKIYTEFISGPFNEPRTLSSLFCLAKRSNVVLNADKQLS